MRHSLFERRAALLMAIGLLVVLGTAAHFRSYATPDAGFLVDEAARVLEGQQLYTDLVDMNLPLTPLLHVAVVWGAKQLGLSGIAAYRIASTTAVLAMLLLAAWLLGRIMRDEFGVRWLLLLLLSFALFDLPEQDFGQREHLVLAFVVPYLLLSAARARGRNVPPMAAALVGLLAGIAMAIKPHFVLLWLVVEGYLRLRRHVQWSKVLPETAAIAAFLLLFVIGILVWMPEYVHQIQLLAGPYTRFLYVPFWQLLLRGPAALLTLFSLLAFVALRRRARHAELLDVFALGALACLVAGAAQQKGFGYHFYPAFALATVVLGILAWEGREAPRNWVTSLYRVLAVSLFATTVVVVGVRNGASIVHPTRDLEQAHMERLLPIVRAHGAGESVYVMSYNISSAYPLINYAGARSASRFAQLWILAAAYMEQLKSSQPLRYHAPSEMGPSERFLNQAVLEDLRDQRPKLLLVLQHARDLPANGFRRLDYVGYFSRDPRIAGLLERYQLIADLGDFTVYERIGEGATRTAPPPGVRPGTRDIVAARQAGGMIGVRDGGSLLAVIVFLLSAAFASIMERARESPRIAPRSA